MWVRERERERERDWQLQTLICWPKKEKEERQGICDSCVTISLYECKCVASLSLLLCINILLPSYHFSVFASLITTLLICLSFCSSLVDFWLRFFCNTTTYTKLPLYFSLSLSLFFFWQGFLLYHSYLIYPLTKYIKKEIRTLSP